MTKENRFIPLVGYTDRLSLRPGGSIAFKVSAQQDGPVDAWLTRSISADPNPKGQGIVEIPADDYFQKLTFAGRNQSFSPGSYGKTNKTVECGASPIVNVNVTVFPTLKSSTVQSIASVGQLSIGVLNAELVIRFADGEITTGIKPKLFQWHTINVRVDIESGVVDVECTDVDEKKNQQRFSSQYTISRPTLKGTILVAAEMREGAVQHHFNGKIESPKISLGDDTPDFEWDFSGNIPSQTASCLQGQEYDLELVNFPARAVTGSTWNGSEMCWRHAEDQYAAIHFHETDIYDFQWETDFSFVAPENMPSGIYVMHIRMHEHEDAMPFYICAPFQKPAAKLCLLIPSFTYLIYGNHARPDYDPAWKKRMDEWGAYPYNPAEFPEYGLSTYNAHPDKSGVCHGSYLRPLMNLRPGYLTFGAADCSGLRHMQADSHLVAWLHNKDIDYDVITDQELHDEGVAAIEKYQCVVTSTHPEYHTVQSLDALQSYRDNGGNLVYLGGNGFYWRIVPHSENPCVFEIRRAEDGLRAWASEVGEYYNAFDGSYGGLWRRNARPPQLLTGIGFSAQGEFNGSYYRRKNFDPEYDWIFRGIEENIIGDFGFSGGGAAGFELDRVETRLGTTDNITVVASSEDHGSDFILVPEEQLTHITTWSGDPVKDLIRADMVYFEAPGGGKVFSTGSITFCGSLPWNAFENNVSTLLENVIERMTQTKASGHQQPQAN